VHRQLGDAGCWLCKGGHAPAAVCKRLWSDEKLRGRKGAVSACERAASAAGEAIPSPPVPSRGRLQLRQ
jgi:hypothetical protein